MSIVTKAQIAAELAEKVNISKTDSANYLNELLDIIANNLISNEKVQFTGFGSFIAEDKKETTGRNPKTGEAIKIEARRSVRFKVGNLLKNTVNS
jgi:DNA-binding protein HU-beta